ncbi:MAG: hypothetical protein H6932_02755 [Burkholderiaceae bacterium]|nr:hypothetical protein [Burkholderiaceae bacterium]
MKLGIRLLVGMSCALLATIASAQQGPQKPPTPEQMREIMQATMGAMVSVMGPMTEAVLEAQMAHAAKPETAERLAAFKKNLYDALLKSGFNGQDAMQIVIATQPPSATPAAK